MPSRPPLDLNTDRLIMSPLVAADLEGVHALWTSPGVRRFLFDDKIIALESTAANIETSARLFAEQGYGMWGARRKEGLRLIGFGGFWHLRGAGEPEILYGVAQEEWGRGYATEIGRALVAYGVDVLRMPVIRGSTDAGNTASVRVLEKLRFRLVHRATVDGLDTVFYERSARPSVLIVAEV